MERRSDCGTSFPREFFDRTCSRTRSATATGRAILLHRGIGYAGVHRDADSQGERGIDNQFQGEVSEGSVMDSWWALCVRFSIKPNRWKSTKSGCPCYGTGSSSIRIVLRVVCLKNPHSFLHRLQIEPMDNSFNNIYLSGHRRVRSELGALSGRYLAR